jgi:1,4-alpha-glucan branching enzyme
MRKLIMSVVGLCVLAMSVQAAANWNDVAGVTAVERARPTGVTNGIYYGEDGTSVTLCTYAASKTQSAKRVFLYGDMTNWKLSADYQLYKDGNYFWITLTGLTPGQEYRYQYAVERADGVRKLISDLYSEKVLHPDDQYEPKKVDPNLISYPSGADGYVTVIQPGKPQFQWSDATLNFKRPHKNNLIIYELWIYDYTEGRSLKGLTKRLDYIQNLGVNAIELMPICEFDGNYNWGYSPNHYFAPDKAYGSETMYKEFIDECHKRGIAVILDMVFNHATGLNPMNKLYPYGSDLANNPWFCTEVPHDDNVYEKWNHDFEPAREMFTRALQYWIKEYHVDGYRMDLSHGLCGCGTKDTYDYSKLMDNIKHYYNNAVLAAAKDAQGVYTNGEPYFILEHWGPNMNAQRPTLVSQGMQCWNNTTNAY